MADEDQDQDQTRATCPKCGCTRQAYDIAPPTECPRCGIIFAKYLASKPVPQVAQQAPAAREQGGVLGRLFYVPDKVDGSDVLGRAALAAVLLLYTAWLLHYPYFSPNLAGSFLHRIHLVFHEAGHVLFIPFGRFMTILGGSLLQCVWPLVLAVAAVLRYRTPFTAAVCLWWSGFAILDVAPYIADARIMDLPLLGESSDEDADLRPERHDWHRILDSLGWLERDLQLARLCFWSGVLAPNAQMTHLLANRPWAEASPDDRLYRM